MKRALALAACLALACTPRAPAADPADFRGERTVEDIHDVPVHGYQVTAVLSNGREAASGELLAVTPSNVYIAIRDSFVRVPVDTLEEVRVRLYEDYAWIGFMTWGILGTASTLTHGYYLVFSAPTWILLGVPASVGAVPHDDVAHVQPESIHLRHFARFPQGLPPMLQDAR